MIRHVSFSALLCLLIAPLAHGQQPAGIAGGVRTESGRRLVPWQR